MGNQKVKRCCFYYKLDFLTCFVCLCHSAAFSLRWECHFHRVLYCRAARTSEHQSHIRAWLTHRGKFLNNSLLTCSCKLKLLSTCYNGEILSQPGLETGRLPPPDREKCVLPKQLASVCWLSVTQWNCRINLGRYWWLLSDCMEDTDLSAITWKLLINSQTGNWEHSHLKWKLCLTATTSTFWRLWTLIHYLV